MKESTITNGNNLVFSYVYEAGEEKNIADDEYIEIIHFEIDPALTMFSYTDIELNSINAVYSISCFVILMMNQKTLYQREQSPEQKSQIFGGTLPLM